MKKKVKNSVLILFMTVAVLLIFNQPLKNWAIRWLGHRQMNQVTTSAIARNEQKSGEFDFSQVDSISAGQVAKASLRQQDIAVLGKIAVPSVDLYLPIVKGVSNIALSVGAGTMKPNQKLGQGNYALAGHDMIDTGILFAPLARVQVGQDIYLTNLKRIYVYQVTVKKKIVPEATTIIDDVVGKKLVTLITCADGGTKRWAIQGELTGIKKATKRNLKVFDK